MHSFLIQTINNRIKHDFSFSLLEAIEYNNWYYNEKIYDYHLSENLSDLDFTLHIPVGSVDFVENFLKVYHNIEKVRPINIPPQLMRDRYLGRTVLTRNKNEINLSGIEKFVKSNDKIKGYADFIKNTNDLPDGQYLISDVINIDSEWRAFIFHNKLVGLQNYLGDFTKMPDINVINDMIGDYTYCPPAYTLDVGINNNGTFLIECHNFWSTGLYGFNDSRILPHMFKSSFEYLLKNKQ